MLAWIAKSAPRQYKATFFAIMASFTNLALSLSSLGTKYMNQIFTVSREVRDAATNAITTPADYSELGVLMIIVTVIAVVAPLVCVLVVKAMRVQTA